MQPMPPRRLETSGPAIMKYSTNSTRMRRSGAGRRAVGPDARLPGYSTKSAAVSAIVPDSAMWKSETPSPLTSPAMVVVVGEV